MKNIAAALFTFLILVGGIHSQSSEEASRQIDALFARYNSQTPGVAVAVVKDGKVIFKKGYGLANLEYDIPITSKTVFHVASVSKQFTAFSLYLLEKQGKISLEDDVRKYVPEVPDFGKPIKIKHLIAHTSGLRDQWSLLTLAGWRMDDVITTEHVMKLIGKQKELNFEPGSQFSYSNSGFTLAAEIVTRVSGESFAEYTKENIFKPLGMNDSQFYNDAEQVVKNRAYSYRLDNGVYEKRNLNYFTAGPTGLMTTLEDLSKWTLNFENPVVGDSEMIAKFNQPSLLNDGQPVLFAVIEGENSYHAKGQFTRNYRGVDLLNHTGHDAAFWVYLLRFPGKRFSVILLSNDEDVGIFKSGLTIAGYYLKNDLKEKKEIANAAVETKAPAKFENNLKDFEGEFYSEELTTTYFAKVKDGKLVLSHSRLRDSVLTETGKDKFSGSISFSVEVEFLRDSKNSVTGFKISNFGAKNVRFVKLNQSLRN